MNRAPTWVRPAANGYRLEQHVVLSLPARRSREVLAVGSWRWGAAERQTRVARGPDPTLKQGATIREVGGSAQPNQKRRAGAGRGPTGSRSRRSDKRTPPDANRHYYGSASRLARKPAED